MAYHSIWNDFEAEEIARVPILPIRTTHKGPSPRWEGDEGTMDIVEEALYYYRANVFFRSYDVEGGGDRIIIYLTLYITECLKQMSRITNKDGSLTSMHQLAIKPFSLPGDRGFPLNSFYGTCENKNQKERLKQYLTQLREEIGTRLTERVYRSGRADKWWIVFTKRKFLNMSLGKN
ncbi:arp2/3 complex 21 kd subunit [Anaeramoeba flamelloides]|uniref:Actin-related protein 2/3 complex subunit 3 n=1 Tax=Anaeramoeba flamelloides TaxID=1746091 RepID=A0ABQ8Z3C1_9EUKA|nr:arp2/3 complex 21 kd subunit [Anaeramoeba flamelloides]